MSAECEAHLFIFNMLSFSEIDSIIEKSVLMLNLKGEPQELYEPAEYMVSIGGKRLRPKMALMTYALFSEKIDKSILNPAMGLEIFHGFTLIHDDIMDNAPLRRGMTTIHKKWDQNIAILSGDAMCIKSYEYMAECPVDLLHKVIGILTKTAIMIMEGQQYDMNFEKRPFVSMDEYITMIGLKTAVLIAASAQIGAVIGRAPDKASDTLYDYGYQLGLAFQIKDDYFDCFGDSSIFGKAIGGDIMCNKKTWLQTESFRRANATVSKKLSAIMGYADISPEEKIKEVLDIYKLLGVKEAAEEEMGSYYYKAIEALDKIPLKEEQREQLVAFAEKLVGRLF